MPTHLDGQFQVTSWKEEQADGLDGTAKVTTARIGQRFTGDIDAETIADLVMAYREDGTADFMGYQRVKGRIGDKSGSFVLQSVGTFDGKEARTRLEVVRGSSVGDLAGLRAEGLAVAPLGSTGTFSFDVEL